VLEAAEGFKESNQAVEPEESAAQAQLLVQASKEMKANVGNKTENPAIPETPYKGGEHQEPKAVVKGMNNTEDGPIKVLPVAPTADTNSSGLSLVLLGSAAHTFRDAILGTTSTATAGQVAVLLVGMIIVTAAFAVAAIMSWQWKTEQAQAHQGQQARQGQQASPLLDETKAAKLSASEAPGSGNLGNALKPVTSKVGSIKQLGQPKPVQAFLEWALVPDLVVPLGCECVLVLPSLQPRRTQLEPRRVEPEYNITNADGYPMLTVVMDRAPNVEAVPRHSMQHPGGPAPPSMSRDELVMERIALVDRETRRPHGFVEIKMPAQTGQLQATIWPADRCQRLVVEEASTPQGQRSLLISCAGTRAVRLTVQVHDTEGRTATFSAPGHFLAARAEPGLDGAGKKEQSTWLRLSPGMDAGLVLLALLALERLPAVIDIRTPSHSSDMLPQVLRPTGTGTFGPSPR
jgi:hypothetical protein